ncbi:MAG TPA: DUF4159 domain-containing protein [Vicinamibacterales bacterium]|nr:DUF4159 domain-containing protein [Vicinamibacterales bacterium]
MCFRRCTSALAATMTILVLAVGAAAQRRYFNQPPHEPDTHNIPYDGRFTFARLKFVSGPGGYYYRGLPAWAHGYDEAERNLTSIMNEVSNVSPHIDGSNVLTLDDPQLLRYPVAYMTEAGYWTMTDQEAAAFRAYLLKGGFVIFDDFRGNFRGGGGWENFETNMLRVLPGARIVDLDPKHPIFHSFFEIDSFEIIPQYYDQGAPVFRGIFENNDPTKRLLAMVNFNTDVSNYWEFSATGLKPIDESNQAYKLGVNYLVYGLTH